MNRWLSLLLLAAVIGCSNSPYPLVPVSGVVTLDGQPLPNARVAFEPQSQGQGLDVGPGSYGKTNAEGHFELETIDGTPGAIVGPHRVAISTFQGKMIPGGDELKVVVEEKVPERYRKPGALSFAVEIGGTTAADFRLDSSAH